MIQGIQQNPRYEKAVFKKTKLLLYSKKLMIKTAFAILSDPKKLKFNKG